MMNIRKISRITGKSEIHEYDEQIVFFRKGIEINFDKNVVDVMLSDKYGNTISLYERNGEIKKIISSSTFNRKLKKLNKLSDLLIKNLDTIYDEFKEGV